MRLEESIIQYLDGALTHEESAELLHLLSVSPEKRALLDEHLKLRELIAHGQKPLAVPAEVEYALAERLPALRPESFAPKPGPVPFASRWISRVRDLGPLTTTVGLALVTLGILYFAQPQSITSVTERGITSHILDRSVAQSAIPQ